MVIPEDYKPNFEPSYLKHIREIIPAAGNRILAKYWFKTAYEEAKKCRYWWKMYQDKPNMFYYDEWHMHLMLWNDAVVMYERGKASS